MQVFQFERDTQMIYFMTIAILTSLFLLINGQNPSYQNIATAIEPVEKVVLEQKKIEVDTPAGVQRTVEEYFSDIPIMSRVAFCESSYRQHDKTGKVLRGKVDNRDVGVMQINEGYHLDRAEDLGLDIHSIEDNMLYARYLYNDQGLRPWKSSSKCWAKSPELALN